METEYRNRALIVIEAGDRDAANQAAQSLDASSGLDTFTVALSPSGSAPATHFLASVSVTNEQWRQLIAMRSAYFPTARITEWYMEAEPDRPERLLTDLGLRRINPF